MEITGFRTQDKSWYFGWGIKTCLGCVVCLDYEDKLAFGKTNCQDKLAFCKTKLPRQTCFLKDKTVKTNLLLASQYCLDKLAFRKTICRDRLCFYQDKFSRQSWHKENNSAGYFYPAGWLLILVKEIRNHLIAYSTLLRSLDRLPTASP